MLTTTRKVQPAQKPSLVGMVMMFLQFIVISAKEFDSQYVQRIGIEGEDIFHYLQTIRSFDEDEDGTLDSYHLYQFVRTKENGSSCTLTDWIYWTKITPGDRDETGFHRWFEVAVSGSNLNTPQAMAFYPYESEVIAVASNSVTSDSNTCGILEAGVFSVSLFYLDINIEEGPGDGVYFGEHFTV